MTWANFLEPGRQGLGIFKVGRGQNDKAQQSPGELPTLTGGFKKIDFLKGHKLKVMFQHLLKGNYRLTSPRKPTFAFVRFKILHHANGEPVAKKTLGRAILSRDIYTGAFPEAEFSCENFLYKGRGFLYLKDRIWFGAGSRSQIVISLNPLQTVLRTPLLVENSYQPTSQRELAYSQYICTSVFLCLFMYLSIYFELSAPWKPRKLHPKLQIFSSVSSIQLRDMFVCLQPW